MAEKCIFALAMGVIQLYEIHVAGSQLFSPKVANFVDNNNVFFFVRVQIDPVQQGTMQGMHLLQHLRATIMMKMTCRLKMN